MFTSPNAIDPFHIARMESPVSIPNPQSLYRILNLESAIPDPTPVPSPASPVPHHVRSPIPIPDSRFPIPDPPSPIRQALRRHRREASYVQHCRTRLRPGLAFALA